MLPIPLTPAQGSTANNSAGYTLSLLPPNGSRYASLSVPNLAVTSDLGETFVLPMIAGAPSVRGTNRCLDDGQPDSDGLEWNKPVQISVDEKRSCSLDIGDD